jgi:hypothetical protein
MLLEQDKENTIKTITKIGFHSIIVFAEEHAHISIFAKITAPLLNPMKILV